MISKCCFVCSWGVLPAQCSIDCNRIPASLGVSPEHLGFPSLTHREGGLWRNTIENNRKRKLWSIRYEQIKGTVLLCLLFEGFSVGGLSFCVIQKYV